MRSSQITHEYEKKITSKDGSFIYLQKDGQFWVSIGKKHDSFSSPGCVVNHACTAYKLLGLPVKYDKYYAINFKILRFADRFKIRKLRLMKQKLVDVKYGKKLVIRYGYINSSSFDRLMRTRKVKLLGETMKVLLLKESDAVWRDE